MLATDREQPARRIVSIPGIEPDTGPRPGGTEVVTYAHEYAQPSDFRRKSTLGLVVAAVLLLSPFSLNNFVQGRHLLGLGSMAVVIIVAFHGWRVKQNRDSPALLLATLVPMIIVFLLISIRTQGMIGALWCFPSLVSFYVLLPERQAWAANLALLVTTIPQALLLMDHAVVIRMAATLICVSLFSAIFVRVITDQQGKLHTIAVTDPLTGLYNRARLKEVLEQAVERNKRTGAPMVLVALDLDHFKKINDTLGHDAGDSVLRRVGQLLRDRLRRVDGVFRLGGEEFLALLSDTGANDGRRVAEELRAAIASTKLLPEQTVTISIGMATLEPGESTLDWMKRADENLYQAKMGGRDRVVA